MIVPSRHFGNTRTGKKICSYETADLGYIDSQTVDFNEHDYFDGFCLFQLFLIKAVRQYGEFSEEVEEMEYMAEYHRTKISDEFVAKEKTSLAIVTSIDICKHGESCIKHVFRK